MASRKIKFGIPPIGWLFIGVIAILFIAVAAVLLQNEEDYSYRGFPIVRSVCQGTEITCWDVSLLIRNQPYVVTFYNHPSDVENIPVSGDALRAVIAMQNTVNHTVYMAVPSVSPGQVGVAGVALARIFGQRYGIMNLNVRGAELGNEPGQVSCANAGPRTLVIELMQGDIDATLMPSANCVQIIATNSSQVVPVAESFAYHVLGVIPTFEQ